MYTFDNAARKLTTDSGPLQRTVGIGGVLEDQDCHLRRVIRLPVQSLQTAERYVYAHDGLNVLTSGFHEILRISILVFLVHYP
jgi:hypothetical protein